MPSRSKRPRRIAASVVWGLACVPALLGAGGTSGDGSVDGWNARSTAVADSTWIVLWKKPPNAIYPLMRNTDEPTMSRHGDGFDVVWSLDDTPATRTYERASVDADGRVRATAHPIVQGWSDLSPTPRLMPTESGQLLAFVGTPTAPHDTPSERPSLQVATSSDGRTWSVEAEGSVLDTAMERPVGFDAVRSGDALVWVSSERDAASLEWERLPASSPPDSTSIHGGLSLLGCCVRWASVLRDADGVVYTAYFSSSADDDEHGFHAARIEPSGDAPARAPLPGWAYPIGFAAHVSPDQRVAMAVRPGGGVFVAYPVGYSQSLAVEVWHVGSATAIVVPGSRGAHRVAATTGPDGTVWLAWTTASKVRIARVRDDAVVPGSVLSIPAPPGASDLFTVAVSSGAPGVLDLVLTATDADRTVTLFTRQVRV